ncbi:hypothetical protein [Desulfocicer niacini]
MIEIKNINWDSNAVEREDLKLAEYAQNKGFSVMSMDGNISTPPVTPIIFIANDRIVWKTSDGWNFISQDKPAEKSFGNLKDALDND